MAPNIVFQYIAWHYLEMPRNILQGWRNFLEFGLNYFSTPQLLRTLFSPWRRYIYLYPRHFNPAGWFNALTFNLMSRGIGAMVRLVLIFVGLLAELVIAAVGAVIFAVWMAMPAIVVGGFLLGLVLIS